MLLLFIDISPGFVTSGGWTEEDERGKLHINRYK